MKNILLKIAVVSFLLMSNHPLLAQNMPKIRLDKQLVAKEKCTIKLYRFDPKNNCSQSKAVSIIYEGKIADCFDYVKTIEYADALNIVKLLRTPSTYGNEDVACFDTDYALLLFDKSNVVYGYVNISLFCNKLMSNPSIPEREAWSQDGLRKVGFSKKGRENLLMLLGNIDKKK